MRSRSPQFLAALLFVFVASISAVLPVVRFCPFGWDEVDLATYATCAAMPVGGTCRPPAPATAAKTATSDCGAMATCPMRPRGASTGTTCGSCPSAAPRTSRSTPQSTADGSRRTPKHHAGPGWCFAEPLIAAAARAHAPAPPTPFAIAAAIVTIEVPATVRPTAPATDPRPPTPPALAKPPIRGPPLLLG